MRASGNHLLCLVHPIDPRGYKVVGIETPYTCDAQDPSKRLGQHIAALARPRGPRLRWSRTGAVSTRIDGDYGSPTTD
jgi:hypothetical protein